MTHPIRDQRSSVSKRRAKQGEFDPEELCRLLTAYLAEQKQRAERRRHARNTSYTADHQDVSYHHIPLVAASAFERTATSGQANFHKASQLTLKTHQDGPYINPQATNLQKTQALDQAAIERALLRNRNQFQWTREMEQAAEVDSDRGVYKPVRRTFNLEFSHLRKPRDKEVERPMSTGDVWDEEQHIPIQARPRPKPTFEGRNDWAQQDDVISRGKTLVKEKSMFLRRTESIWLMKGKKDRINIIRQDKNEVEACSGDLGSPTDGSKGGKSSFLARFKRQPPS